MKKFYKYLLLLIISLLLFSCNDESIYFNYDEMIDKVVKIDVVDANGGDLIKSKTYKTCRTDFYIWLCRSYRNWYCIYGTLCTCCRWI